MDERFAPCGCRLLINTRGPRIDTESCKLVPVLDAFHAIEEMAAQIAQQRVDRTPKRKATKQDNHTRTGGTWQQRWAPVQAAISNLDRVLNHQQIPRAELSCAACNKPIESGSLLTFHEDCYTDRFETKVNLRTLKSEAQRRLSLMDPARRVLMALPDQILRVEAPGVLCLVLEFMRQAG